ncbi:chorismate-binding protein [Seonamhaeicola marinus]|uniref:Isochorismate synthase n=1 Tax=Seonamhaeicola marinus TaxID=1912246 RepID=A0A5D0I6Z0_9FLAO|nr:chorismate-binding protein [Seonamhaeicola marinus]TYA78709.1 isochorismate synthase [Seonamhaeicola marinus]
MEDFFKRVQEHHNLKLPFVVYRKPNKSEVKAILQKSDELIFTSEFKEQGFVFSPFDNTEKSILIRLADAEVMSIENPILDTIKADPQKQTEASATEKQRHMFLVKKGINAIKEGLFKKVVLSRKESVTLENKDPISIFKRLLGKYASAFVYCWYHPEVGLWLGATPETLVKIEGNRFSIMALAGTQVYKNTLDVVWQDKEIQEQQYVTDFVVDSLKPSAESIKVSDTTTVKAGNLLHLKTMISAQLKPTANLKDVIYAIHPTPAVCGLPKKAAKDFILKEEDYNRSFYTGFLGELNLDAITSPRSGRRNIENRAYAITRKSTQLYVNLRCMQLVNDKANIYIGGGITESSNPEKEWEETVAKSLVMKSIL